MPGSESVFLVSVFNNNNQKGLESNIMNNLMVKAFSLWVEDNDIFCQFDNHFELVDNIKKDFKSFCIVKLLKGDYENLYTQGFFYKLCKIDNHCRENKNDPLKYWENRGHSVKLWNIIEFNTVEDFENNINLIKEYLCEQF